MITEITTKALEEIKAKIAGVAKTSLQKSDKGILVNPSVVAAIVDGKCRRVTSVTYKVEAVLSVLVTFKSMKGEEDRRLGVTPFMEGIMGLLLLKDLGLKIDPLVPEGFSDVTSDGDYTSGEIKYVIRFGTGFNIKRQSDEAVTDLLRIGLSYCLKPGDNNVDASDTVTLSQ